MDAAALKDKGNAAFSAKKYEEAIEYFGKALELDGNNHVLWSNRSAAYASLKQFEAARQDAEKCVQLNPQWAKGYVRLGAALHGLGEYDGAVTAYDNGLKIEPQNSSLQEGLASVKRDMASARDPFGKIFGPDTFARVQSNPALSAYLMQPDYVQMLNHCITNPSMAQMFMKDQRMLMTFLHLSGINLDSASSHVDPQPKQSDPAPPKPAPPTADAPAPAANTISPAQQHKEKGNALYKERKFAEALEAYQAALDLDPTNTTYLLNRTAVYFEMEDFEKCIAECDAAIEHAYENRSGFKTIAKLMTRKALSLQRLKRYPEAIELFKKALVEDRNADTLAKLQACEKEFKKFEEESYYNPQLALQKKEEGNEHFKNQRYPEAVEAYTEAIKRDPKEHTAYSNRAAAYLKLCAYNEALKDSEKCIELNPSFVKAYARKGHAYFWTKQYHRALQSYDEGLRLEPTNAECIDGKASTMRKIQEMQSEGGDDEAAQRAMSDPEIAAIMQDSYMQLVLREMQTNPQRISEYMADPNIASKINKLITAGVLRVGGPNTQPRGKR